MIAVLIAVLIGNCSSYAYVAALIAVLIDNSSSSYAYVAALIAVTSHYPI